mgnify:CR=1 FL=1
MIFYDQNNHPKTIPNKPGEKIRPVIKRIKQKNGTIEYEKISEVNTYEKIQAAKEATLIYNIIERYENGDISAINKKQGQYLDITNAPKSIHDLKNISNEAQNNFVKLPEEIKTKIIKGENVTKKDIQQIIENQIEITPTQIKQEETANE